MRRSLGLAALLLLASADAGRADVPQPRSSGVWGAVRTGGGAAVPGAEVLLWRGAVYPGSMAASGWFRRDVECLDLLASDPSPAARATSDPRGEFQFRDLEPGNYVVEARGPGGTCALSSLTRVEVGAFSAVPLLLAPAFVVDGRVLGADGTPFRGHVLLQAARREPDGLPHPYVVGRWVATAENGTFRIEYVPPGPWNAFAGHGGRRWEWVGAVEAGPEGRGSGPLEAHLPARGPRVVRVLDAAGRPVVGARVIAQGKPWIAGGTTGADGRASVEGSAGVALSVQVGAPGHEPVQVGADAGTDELVVRMRAGAAHGRVRGRVLADGGAPVAGVALQIMRGTSSGFLVPRSAKVLSGPDGAFELDGVEAGAAWIQALGAGVASPRLSDLSGPPRRDELFDVPVGGGIDVDVRTAPAASVSGIVVDEQGAPVAGALVRWESSMETVWHRIEDAPPSEALIVTDASGSFSIRSLAAGVWLDVQATAPGFVEGVGSLLVPAADSKAPPVRIVLARARWVGVYVRWDAEPAAGAVLDIAPSERGPWAPALAARAVVGPTGVSLLGPLPNAHLELRASHPDAAWPVTRRIAPDESGPIRVDLQAGMEIKGRVTDAAGLPLAGTYVSAERQMGGSRRWHSATAGDLGEFEFTGLAAGEWRLSAERGAAKGSLRVEAGTRDVRLVLHGDATAPEGVEVHVVGHDDGPVALASIRWRAGDGLRRGDGYIGDGHRVLEMRSAPGPEGMEIEVTGAVDAARKPLPYGPAHIGPLGADEWRVEIRLPPGRPIVGQVVGPAGSDVSGIEVVARGRSALAEAPIVLGVAKTADDGSFAIGSGGEGDVELTVRRRGLAEAVGLVTAVHTPTGGAAVTLELVPRVDVVLTILDPEGAPADGYLVEVGRPDAEDAEHQRVWTRAPGEARLVGLVPGAAYELRISAGDELHSSRWTPQTEAIRLAPARRLHGTVLDDKGDPFAWAFLGVRDASGEPVGYAIAAPDGRFELPAPNGDSFRVAALPPFNPWGNGFVEIELGSGDVEARVGEEVTLVVQRGVTPTFRLDAPDTGPWGSNSLVLTRARDPWDPDAPSGRVALPAAGAQPLPPLVPGARYDLFLPVGATNQCAFASFTATEGGEVVLTPVPAATIRGRVAWPAGAEAGRVLAREHGYSIAADFAEDGSFVMDGFPPGLAVRLEATARVGSVTWTGRAVARPGDDVLIEPSPVAPEPALPTDRR